MADIYHAFSSLNPDEGFDPVCTNCGGSGEVKDKNSEAGDLIICKPCKGAGTRPKKKGPPPPPPTVDQLEKIIAARQAKEPVPEFEQPATVVPQMPSSSLVFEGGATLQQIIEQKAAIAMVKQMVTAGMVLMNEADLKEVQLSAKVPKGQLWIIDPDSGTVQKVSL